MNLFHKHTWSCVQLGVASFSKRDEDADTFYVDGCIETCQACPTTRIVPLNKNLFPVEVDICPI